MNRRITQSFVWLGLWLLGMLSPCKAQKDIVSWEFDKLGTKIDIKSVFDPPPPSGFVPIRVQAQNETKDELRVELSFESKSYNYRNQGSFKSDFTPSLASQSAQTWTFMVPVSPEYHPNYGNVQMEIRCSTALGTKVTSYYGEGLQDNYPAIAISTVLAASNLTKLNDELRKVVTRYGRETFGSRFNVNDLPEDWLGYSGFDVVMMEQEEWILSTPGVKSALLQWVRMGGRLDVYHTGEATRAPSGLRLPKLVKNNGAEASAESIGDGALGFGRITFPHWDGKDLPINATVSEFNVSTLPKRLYHFRNSYDNSADWGLLRAFGERSFGGWQVILFLILFGILIGPINLFVLAPSGRRHRLFFTTPLISLGASLILVALILFQDGTGGNGRRFALVQIDSEEKAAFVHQEQVSRTGVLMGSSFETTDPSLISQVVMRSSPWTKLKDSASDSQPMNTSLSGRTWSGNWFQSRSEQGQEISSVIPTRSRIEVKPGAPEAAPTIVSSFGFDLKEFWFRDAQGQLWKAPNSVAVGQSITLIKTTEAAFSTWFKNVYEDCSVGLATQWSSVEKINGRFYAEGESTPFLQDTLKAIRWSADRTVLTGSL